MSGGGRGSARPTPPQRRPGPHPSGPNAALLCARGGELPYSLMSALSHDLEVLGRLTAIEPAMFLLLCERAGMPGGTAVRLPVLPQELGYLEQATLRRMSCAKLRSVWRRAVGASVSNTIFR